MYIVGTNRIFADFLKFEFLFFGVTSFEHNNFYNILHNNNIELSFYSFLELNLLKDPKLDRLFVKDINYFLTFFQNKKFYFTEFNCLKSDLDIFSAYLFLFLLKTFSIKSKQRLDEADLFAASIKDLSIDRNDFINNFSNFLYRFFIFVEIKHNCLFSLSKKQLRKFVFRFLDLCDKKKLILIKDFSILNRSYKSVEFVTFPIPYLPHIVFYSHRFNHYIRSESEFYAYNIHFFSIVEITKMAKYSTSFFKISPEIVSKLFERFLYIDRVNLSVAFNWLLRDQGFNTSTDLDKEMEELLVTTRKFLVEKDIISLRLCHSRLSKLLTLIRIRTVLNMNFDNLKIYLPFMFCFRGRIYELTEISFTFYKEFRFCLYIGFYDTETLLAHQNNSRINLVLTKQFNLFNDFEWFNKLSIIRKHAAVWLFISIGALQKVDLGYEVHISKFIQKGLELWKTQNYDVFDDVYEKIEFNYLINLINDLILIPKNLKKRIFWKDAPASCFQHQLLILGARDDLSYKICNLDSEDTWYDPYTHLIRDFFSKNRNKVTNNLYTSSNLMLTSTKYFEIFSRKRLKKILMTESYGAGYKKLSFFFTLDLRLDHFSKEDKEAVLGVWDKFFEYITDSNPLFAQNSKNIVEHFVKNEISTITNPDFTKVDYSCFRFEIKQSEIYINKKRHTLQTKTITPKLDVDQFKVSIRANFVQSQDAFVARQYDIITGMWSIHDCFSIDFLNITYMVSLLNELMNGEFYNLGIRIGEKKMVYSIFIIL